MKKTGPLCHVSLPLSAFQRSLLSTALAVSSGIFLYVSKYADFAIAFYFLAVLGLHCCTGFSLAAVCRLLVAVAFLVEHGV